jgi:hypothetical protein
MKGHVSVEHTVWCWGAVSNIDLPPKWGVRCDSFVQASGPSRCAQKSAQAQGWRRFKNYGWVCPHHLRMVQEAEAAAANQRKLTD